MKAKVIIISLFVGATSAIAYAISKKKEKICIMILCIPRLRPGALFILANKKKQALKTSAHFYSLSCLIIFIKPLSPLAE